METEYEKRLAKQKQHWEDFEKELKAEGKAATPYHIAIRLLGHYNKRWSVDFPGVSFFQMAERVLRGTWRSHTDAVTKTLDDHDKEHDYTVVAAGDHVRQDLFGLYDSLEFYLKERNEGVNTEGDLFAILWCIHAKIIELGIENWPSKYRSPNDLYYNPICTKRIEFFSNNQPFDFLRLDAHLPVTIRLSDIESYTASTAIGMYYFLQKFAKEKQDENPKAFEADDDWKHNAAVNYLSVSGTDASLQQYVSPLGEKFNQWQADQELSPREQLLYNILLAKATQHPEILHHLSALNERDEIVCRYPNKKCDETYLGIDQGNIGRNTLGKLWKRISVELILVNVSGHNNCPVVDTLLQETADVLGLDYYEAKPKSSISLAELLAIPSEETTTVEQIKQYRKSRENCFGDVGQAMKYPLWYLSDAVKEELPNLMSVELKRIHKELICIFTFDDQESQQLFKKLVTHRSLSNDSYPTDYTQLGSNGENDSYCVMVHPPAMQYLFAKLNLYFKACDLDGKSLLALLEDKLGDEKSFTMNCSSVDRLTM